MSKDYVLLNLIPDNVDRTAKDYDYVGESVQAPLSVVPRVGDRVFSYSQRDRDGNYLNKDAPAAATMKTRKVLSGTVSRVEHIIEERGRNSAEHQWVHHVNVYFDAEDFE